VRQHPLVGHQQRQHLHTPCTPVHKVACSHRRSAQRR
jgi:hypothetical protein